MRFSTFVIAACMAGAATAATAEDRYGPTRYAAIPPETAAQAAFQPAAALSWGGKVQPQTTQEPALRGVQPVQPLLYGALRNTSALPVMRPLQASLTQPAPQVMPAAPVQHVMPQPAPQAAMPSPAVQHAPAPQAAPQPAPQPVAHAAPQVAPQPAAHAAGPVVAPVVAQAEPAPKAQPTQRVAVVPLAGGPPAQAAQPTQTAQAPAMGEPLSNALFDGVPAPEEASANTAAANRARLAANAANTTGAVAPRYYSLHSSYGMAADPIPLSQTGVGQ